MGLASGATLAAALLLAAISGDTQGQWQMRLPCQSAAVFIGHGTILAETTNTPAERARGLMWRESMAEGHGMIFIMDKAEEQDFWMKNTLIPLRIVFIREGRVVSWRDGKPNDETSLTSEGPADLVLEVNVDEPLTRTIAKGDPVSWQCVDQG